MSEGLMYEFANLCTNPSNMKKKSSSPSNQALPKINIYPKKSNQIFKK